jgi:hypothetical protein
MRSVAFQVRTIYKEVRGYSHDMLTGERLGRVEPAQLVLANPLTVGRVSVRWAWRISRYDELAVGAMISETGW